MTRGENGADQRIGTFETEITQVERWSRQWESTLKFLGENMRSATPKAMKLSDQEQRRWLKYPDWGFGLDDDGISTMHRALDSSGNTVGAIRIEANHNNLRLFRERGSDRMILEAYASGYPILAAIAVTPSVRSVGIGHRLVDAARESARSRGAIVIQGLASREDDAAPFFEKSGFTVLEEGAPLPRQVNLDIPLRYDPSFPGRWFYCKL